VPDPSTATTVAAAVERIWDEAVLPALEEYVRVPALSPAFDPDWEAHGHLDRAVELVRDWCAARPVPGLQAEVLRLPGLTPLLLLDVPASAGADPRARALLYGHLDKQPEMVGWRDGLGPWEPVVQHGRLYGRGGADDGYAPFAVCAALEAMAEAGLPHPRCLVLVEASEESGSIHLDAHVEALAERLGRPDLVVGLDSGCATWDRLWTTSSLRGLVALTVTVEVLAEGVHSGSHGGVAPSSFRVLRALLDRIEDADTGRVLVPALWADVPPNRREELAATAAELGEEVLAGLPLVPGVRPMGTGPEDWLRARTWEPSIAYVGVAGMPPPERAGNVIRPATTVKLAVRLPPTCPADRAADALVDTLTADPPHGARVAVEVESAETGWDAPPTAPWLAAALAEAGTAAFGRPPAAMGEGGSIPFIGKLGRRFPDAQFLVTGVLGPGSNAHGPNEFLHLAMARGVTSVVAGVLAALADADRP